MEKPSKISVLLLEDQQIVRTGMRLQIQICEPSAQIDEASSYEEAIEKFKNNYYDIAFLDIDLKEEKNGIDVLKQIRSDYITTRAIMLSGSNDKDTVMNCISEGASGFISKDTKDQNVFRRALDVVFQGSVFLPDSAIGRGGFSPSSAIVRSNISAETLGITGRNLEVLFYLCQGMQNKVIAHHMNIKEETIRKDYVPKLFQILKVSRRTELVIEVARRGISIPTPKNSRQAQY